MVKPTLKNFLFHCDMDKNAITRWLLRLTQWHFPFVNYDTKIYVFQQIIITISAIYLQYPIILAIDSNHFFTSIFFINKNHYILVHLLCIFIIIVYFCICYMNFLWFIYHFIRLVFIKYEKGTPCHKNYCQYCYI